MIWSRQTTVRGPNLASHPDRHAVQLISAMPAAAIAAAQKGGAASKSPGQAREQPPMSWQRDTNSVAELIDASSGCGDRQQPEGDGGGGGSGAGGGGVLVTIRCLRAGCPCGLSNQEALMLRAVRDVRLVTGVWTKLGGGRAAECRPGGVGLALTDRYPGWLEVLNESGAAAPAWSSVKEVARARPQSMFLRRDQKCWLGGGSCQTIFADGDSSGSGSGSGGGGGGGGSCGECAEPGGLLRAGAVLRCLESGSFPVAKKRGGPVATGAATRPQPLLKCLDSEGRPVYLGLSDKCSVSPLAGPDGISGVQRLESLLARLRLPLSARLVPPGPPPLPWLPSSARHGLRLTLCAKGDLLFLASLADADRLLVVTPDMLDGHAFRLGAPEQRRHQRQMQRHWARADQFLRACHPAGALRHLTDRLTDAAECSIEEETPPATPPPPPPPPPMPLPVPVPTQGPLMPPPPTPPTNLDELLDEVEDIYCYVRTGRMPNRRASCEGAITLPPAASSPPPPPPPPLPLRRVGQSPLVRRGAARQQ